MPRFVRDRVRARLLRPLPGARTTISEEDWATAPVQLLLGRKRADA
jgi:hypothetical protein